MKKSNDNTKSQVLSFNVTQSLRDDIEELTSNTDAESRAEFLRNCVSINKTLVKYAKQGFTDIVIQKPDGSDRKHIYLKHLINISQKEK